MSFQLIPDDNIFIAGANGMVGSSIKREFIRLGYKEKGLQGKLLCPTRDQLNLLNYAEVDQWFEKNNPSIVIIAAAKVGGIIANYDNPFDFVLKNLKIQTNLIELSWKYKVRKLLFLGSSCIYPKFSEQPIKEEYLLSDPLEPTNEYYAIAKIAGIKLCQSLMIQHQFNVICVMPTNLYGPGDNYHPVNSHVIPSLIRKFYDAKNKNLEYVTCWGSGKPLREFLYVDDLARACVFLLEKWNPANELSSEELRDHSKCLVNVGTKDEISIKRLAEKISEVCQYNGNIKWDKEKPDGTPRKKIDTTRINELGWYAETKLEEGLQITLDYYKKEIREKKVRFK
tara:strand:- start:82 stop:1101 length:1020 start_codon:yes stop_codon:yes gene_type:complete